MGPYRTPGGAPPEAPPPPVDDDWLVLALPLGIALPRVACWLLGAEPLGPEPLLAIAIALACGAALVGQALASRRRKDDDDR